MKIMTSGPRRTKASELVPGDACAVTNSNGNHGKTFCIVLSDENGAVGAMDIANGADFHIEPDDIVEKLPDAIFCPYGP